MVCTNHFQSWETFNSSCSDGKEARQVMEQTADDVDQVKRSSTLDLISAD
jgi:hypothetical protein